MDTFAQTELKVVFFERLSKLKFKSEDLKLISKAFEYAETGHIGQMRKSGEPYFNHPVRVALRCMDYSLDAHTIIGALTHDLVEDVSGIQFSDIEKTFGKKIAELVEALTKVKNKPNLTVKRIFGLARRDFRVLLIKLFDRLDNLTDVQVMRRKKQRRICWESISIYSNVAYSLGLKIIYEEINALSYQVLYPKYYKKVVAKLKESEEKQKQFLQIGKEKIEKHLQNQKVQVVSVLRQPAQFVMNNKIPDNESPDNALGHYQILTANPIDCYTVAGILHTNFPAIPLSFRDYISNPTANGKKNLETKILLGGQPMICEITTKDFDRKNDFGIIRLIQEGIYQKGEYQKFLDLCAEAANEDIRIQSIIDSANRKTIQVLSPAGDCHEMRYDSCVLDFAFQIHSSIGLKCKGAIINNSCVKVSQRLYDGDVVRVLYDENKVPEKYWEEIVRSPKSKKELHKYFSSLAVKKIPE